MENSPFSHRELFVQLILQNQQLALIGMGLSPHPSTGKKEVNRDYASAAITTLQMLKEKTTGNLSEEESRFLDLVIEKLLTKFNELESGQDQ